MGLLRNFVNPLHNQTSRNYIERMKNNKIYCSKIAKKYGKDYWDGKRGRRLTKLINKERTSVFSLALLKWFKVNR